MSLSSPVNTAAALLASDKGLLAIDESIATCNKRFAPLGIPQTEAKRRDYRELLITTPNLSQCISGLILCDETFRQHTNEGLSFPDSIARSGIIPGIKVDLGAKELAGHTGEKVTEGLDGLRPRLAEYARLGACFAKWRAVFTIGERTPTEGCIQANAQALARYAALCQEAGLLPMVEPEILMEGKHSLTDCRDTTEAVLREVFDQLSSQRVKLEGMLLKCNMVLPGTHCTQQETVEAVADATVHCLMQVVPPAVPGVAFLSGGQSPELASSRLDAINNRFRSRLPWTVTFSFGRAIQQPALAIWRGQDSERLNAQKALNTRVRCDRAARRGEYTQATELAFR